MDFYRAYRDYNLALGRGEKKAPARGRCGYPALAVYTGGGSSHSWLWFAWLFDRLGLYDLVFPDEEAVASGGLAGRQVLAVSGGDTFGIAESLGPEGASAVGGFLKQGGLYLGSCAGAYLLLNSSKEHLKLFNWVPAKISNLASRLPRALRLPHKFCSPYGCSFVYHPVREAVGLTGCGREPWSGAGAFEAPLYGGPAMIAGDEKQVLARYQRFTERTSFLVDPGLAADTLLGRAAVLRAEVGRGVCYLFGPHFEHPGFPEANRLLAECIYRDMPDSGRCEGRVPTEWSLSTRAARSWLRDVKREVSNVRIVSMGLEPHPARWVVGRKVYEPAKLRVFAEAAWDALRGLERMPRVHLPAGAGDSVALWGEATERVRDLRAELRAGGEGSETARAVFPLLNQASARLLHVYFHSRLEGLAGGRRALGAA